MSVSDPGKKIEWGADSEPRKNERVPSSANNIYQVPEPEIFGNVRNFLQDQVHKYDPVCTVSEKPTLYRNWTFFDPLFIENTGIGCLSNPRIAYVIKSDLITNQNNCQSHWINLFYSDYTCSETCSDLSVCTVLTIIINICFSHSTQAKTLNIAMAQC